MGWIRASWAGILAATLFVSSMIIPPIGYLTCLASPLPIAFTMYRGGWKQGAAATAAAMVAIGAITHPLTAATFGIQFGAGGLIIGMMLTAKRPPHAVVGGFTMVSLLAFGAILGVSAASEGLGVVQLMEETLADFIARANEAVSEADPETILAVQQWADDMRNFAMSTFFGTFAGLSVFTGWANAIGVKKLAAMKGEATVKWNDWRAPEWWIWGLIAAGLAAVAGSGFIRTAGINMVIPALVVYFLQGLAIMHYLFEARSTPMFFRGAAYALLFLQMPLMLMVATLGAFDMWFDFRSRWSPSPPADNMA